ncbi:PEP-utilizing enzyme [Streptomyces sp. LP05-1]|uniref:PEP-utilizing enzyme n=1 Tax=Streptomyces pyxinae TaxID=2970734 RepID=A0ABT2CBG0_9ACTN|nr:PEP/pyruvate-binding domain-containing protein [Streptomyces sp. LP05-1]MCS0634745.1 PEP-utilizing enzyme [Streptomyces sp. LP05-1]
MTRTADRHDNHDRHDRTGRHERSAGSAGDAGTGTRSAAAHPWAYAPGDPAQVGQKFARLHRMREAGLPVPPLFCLPASAFREAARPLLPGIEQALAGIDYADPESVEEGAARVRALFLAAPLPAGLTDRISAACDERFEPGALVAVRACALDGEDSADDPYAGMSDSFLYVPRDEVPDRVRRCWASGFTAASLLYRHTRGRDPLGAEVAVGVQEMALGERSFVLFTRDPRTGDRTTVVAAGHGIGEGVVQERVGVDHYFLPAGTEDGAGESAVGGPVERRIAAKPEMLGLDPAQPGAGPVPLPVPEALRERPVLDDAELRRLAATGAEVERLFGGVPQDIEGTFTPDGRLHLVQARPIAIDLGLRVQWSNANVTESFPGVTTALTYTFAQRFYRMIFHDLYHRLGVDARTLHGDEADLERMIGWHRGRIYYRLDAWYRLHSRLAVFPLFQASWERMMGLDPAPPAARPGPLRLARPLAGVVRRFAVHDTAMRDFESWWEALIAPHRGRDWGALDPLARVRELRAVWREAGEHWGVTLMNDSVLSTYAGLAQRLLDRWAPGVPLNDLLCGEERNHSTAALLSAVRLAERLRERPEVMDTLAAAPAEEVWPAVRDGAFGTELAAAFAEHLRRYGDRGVQELKMEQPNLRRTPWLLLDLAADYARAGLDADTLRRRELRVRAEAERRLAASGMGATRLRALRALLARLRRCVGHRENSRYRRSELFGMAKEIFHSLGADLVAEGVLTAPEDACHLTQDELLGWFEGTGPAEAEALRALAAARRAEYERPGPELPMRFATLGAVRRTRAVAGGQDPGGRGAEDPGAGPDAPAAGAAAPGVLRGLGSSAGTVRGRARAVLDPREPVEPGSILVARETDPGWLFLMLRSAGIVVERGTMLSHTAITGRKFGIPAIVALPGATTAIPDGALVEMDGATGVVTVLEHPEPGPDGFSEPGPAGRPEPGPGPDREPAVRGRTEPGGAA